MKIPKIFRAIIALLVASIILLLSDLSNRNKQSKPKQNHNIHATSQAVNGRHYRIGVTYPTPEKIFDSALNGLWKGLSEFGFVKDSNLTVLVQHANGEMANLNQIHLNMDNQDIDLILVLSTPAISSALAVVEKHPIVFTVSYTPLEAGAGKSYTDHRPNITGVGSFPPVKKTIDFIHETIPGSKCIGTIYNSSEANSRKVVETARKYARNIGMELAENTVVNSSEVYQAITALCMRKVDAVWITGDNTTFQAYEAIVKVCRENKTPLIVNDGEYVENGALAAIGISWFATGYRTTKYVAEVLNGKSPSEIPIENYVEEDVVVNYQIAKDLGIRFPDKYIQQKSTLHKERKYKFCLAHYIDSPITEDAEKGIRDELRNIGLIEGQDYTIKVLNAQGDITTLNSIADAISSEKWDLVFTTSTPTIQAISRKVSNSPIVFTNVGDPVHAGLGRSFSDHNPNLTGISTMSDFAGLIKLVKEYIPGIKIIGTVYVPGESNSVAYKTELEKVAKNDGLRLISVPANSVTEVSDASLTLANKGIQAYVQISDNLTASCGSTIIKIAYDNHIPYFTFISNQVDQGAVAAIARDFYIAGIDAVRLAKEILEGKPPKEIPIRYVSKSILRNNPDAIKYFKIKQPKISKKGSDEQPGNQ